ncbi:negative regulator of septation ring formation, partial [Bradyrhizobium sp. Cham227]|nr:negative regulator of septation ring formation [Bradyrhizobium brasilense]
GSATAEAVVASAREAQSTLAGASTEAADLVRSLAADMERSLSMAGSATAESITSGAREAQSTLVNASTEAATKVSALAADIQRALSMAGSGTVEMLTAGAREAQNALVTASTEAANHVKSLAVDVERTLTSVGTNTAQAIVGSARDAQSSFVATSSEAASQIREISAEIERSLTTASAETAQTILGSAREAQSSFAATSADAAAQIRTLSTDIERALGAVTAKTTDNIQTSAQNAQAALITMSNEVSTKVKTTSADIERSVLSASSAFGSAMTGKTDEIVTYVQQQTERLSQMVDGRRGSLVEALTAKTTQLSSDMDRATADALKAIETRGLAFSQTMAAHGSDVARNITSAGDQATGAVAKSLKELEQASRAAIDQSRQVSISAVTEMQETSKILRTDTVALFERLREGNILLQEVLTGAHDNLNSLERALVTRVADFVSAMNDVTSRNGVATQTLEDQLTVFNSKTGKALEDLGALSSQFETHGKALIDAAAVVEQANRSTTASVSERKSALEALVTTIDLRTTDLDQRLSRFTGLLDESLGAAEERARDIARVVAETAGAGSAAISRQFEAVRQAAENERQQTVDAMNDLYQQSNAETDAMFKESTEKFSAMVTAMKQMASEMQSELEATRNELRRGVLEMPQEAAENTAQMRKVIVDQIEALAELNRIVAHHGRGLDVVSTNRASVRHEEPVVAAAGGRGDVRMRDNGNSASTLPPPDLGMASSRRTEAPPVSPAGSNNNGDGWLSDLLNRSDAPPPAPQSRDAQQRPRPQQQPVNPLESLSLDIGRLMDRTLAAEMWDRYQRGENKAFSKRLYTPAGQKAFDEVARKYRADRGFKQTVDRYIAEFERLLDEVARDGRGQQELSSHLTSETGLVYTLLAHAAGRLG